MKRANGGSALRCSWLALAVVAVGFLPCASARAETLVEALAAAYQYNPELDAARAKLRATDEEIAKATSGYRPTISVDGEVGHQHSFVRGASVLGGKNASESSPKGYTVSLSQPLFRGFQTTNAVNAAESNVRAEREVLRGTEQGVLENAVVAYADVVRFQAVVRLREDNLNFLSKELKATQDRFAVGEVTKTDVAQAQARRAQAVSDLDLARANLKSGRAIFEQVIGHAPANLVEPTWRTGLLPKSLNEAIDIATRENPIVVAALYQEQAARFEVDQIRGELLPTATLEASHNENYDPSENTDKSYTTSVKAQVHVPIYTNGSVEARVRQAKHTQIQRLQQIEQQRAEAQSSVAQAWSELQGFKAQLESDKAQIDFNKTALTGVQEEEKVGQRTLLDVLNARLELVSSEVQLEITKRNLVVSTYKVVAAIGRLNVGELGAVATVYDPEVHADEVRHKWFGIDVTHDDGRVDPNDAWNTRVDHEPVK